MAARKKPLLQKAATIVVDDDPPPIKFGFKRTRSISYSNSATFERDPIVTSTFNAEKTIPIQTINNEGSIDNDEKVETEEKIENKPTLPLLPPILILPDNTSLVMNDSEDEMDQKIDDDYNEKSLQLILVQNKEKTKRKEICKKVLIGLSFAAVISMLSVCTSQFAANSLQLTLERKFYSPYFLTWFNTCWLVSCFPLFIIVSPLLSFFKIIQTTNFKEIFHESKHVFGPDGFTMKTIALQNLPFLILWITMNYSFNQALGHISPGKTTSAFATCSSFIYLLSWVFLHDAFVPIRIISFLLSIIGTILMAHAERHTSVSLISPNFTGIMAAVIASAAAAIYKVLFIKVVGVVSLCQISMFTTLIGVCNLTLNWIILLILVLTEAEQIFWEEVPWNDICASAAFSLMLVCCIIMNTAINNNLFISIGFLFVVPINAVVDIIFRRLHMNSIHVAGSVCILTSFTIMMFPENLADRVLKFIALKVPPDTSVPKM